MIWIRFKFVVIKFEILVNRRSDHLTLTKVTDTKWSFTAVRFTRIHCQYHN